MRLNSYPLVAFTIVILFSVLTSNDTFAQKPSDQHDKQQQDESGYHFFPRWDCHVVIIGDDVTMTYTIKTNKSRKYWMLESFEPVVSKDPEGNTIISGEVRMVENPAQENHGIITVVKTVNLAGIDKEKTFLDVGLLQPDGSTSSKFGRKKKGLMGYDG